MAEPPQQPVQIQIEVDDATAQGVYTNLALIAHTETEFVFDFLFVQPQAPKARVRARVLTSPAHAKRFLLALQDNIRKFEQRFGPMKVLPEPDQRIGPYL